MSGHVLSRTEGHVGIAALNRPEVLNALSVELMDKLIAVLAVDEMPLSCGVGGAAHKGRRYNADDCASGTAGDGGLPRRGL